MWTDGTTSSLSAEKKAAWPDAEGRAGSPKRLPARPLSPPRKQPVVRLPAPTAIGRHPRARPPEDDGFSLKPRSGARLDDETRTFGNAWQSSDGGLPPPAALPRWAIGVILILVAESVRRCYVQYPSSPKEAVGVVKEPVPPTQATAPPLPTNSGAAALQEEDDADDHAGLRAELASIFFDPDLETGSEKDDLHSEKVGFEDPELDEMPASSEEGELEEDGSQSQDTAGNEQVGKEEAFQGDEFRPKAKADITEGRLSRYNAWQLNEAGTAWSTPIRFTDQILEEQPRLVRPGSGLGDFEEEEEEDLDAPPVSSRPGRPPPLRPEVTKKALLQLKTGLFEAGISSSEQRPYYELRWRTIPAGGISFADEELEA